MAKGRKTGGKPLRRNTESHIACSKCKEMKLYSEFHKDKNMTHGVHPLCKVCRREHYGIKWQASESKKNSDNRWYKDNKLKVKDSHLKRLYGVDLDTYNSMFMKQKGCCAICERHQSEFKRALSLDHCHSTGKARELLCLICNWALWRYEDSDVGPSKYIEYIRRNR